jgi:predicted CXXCH cytochrome family protein
MRRSFYPNGGFAFTVVLWSALLAGCGREEKQGNVEVVWPDAEYVGSFLCRECHEDAFAAWQGSHHQRAMEVASADVAAGDFDGSTFAYRGVTSTFETAPDGQLWVTTDDAEGEPARYHVSHTFGVEPLQQYLLDVVSWDTRAEAEGGWFHLYDDQDVTAGDVLHWTARSQNWNGMCADCHSTNVVNGFDAETERFATTFSEVSVGCEACHGPGANHVTWARRGAAANNMPPYSSWIVEQAEQVDTCARCHSRRSKIAEGFAAGDSFLDYFMPALLTPPLYHGDGQILDEVYVYGSFLQSKMYQRGVRCSDCHDPHSATLRATGNTVCTQCHSLTGRADFPTLLRKNYDDPAHHLHTADTPGAACVSCHMPDRTYMAVDDRRDHSFRIPRPDLTVALGVPNACDQCHDQGPAWAQRVIEERFGPDRPVHYGETLPQAFTGRIDAEQSLSALARDVDQPKIVRASVMSQLGAFDRGYSLDAIKVGLGADEPLLTIGALRSVGRLEPRTRWRYLKPLLSDPVRAVRTEAALAAAPFLGETLSDADRLLIETALDDYVEGQAINADRPEAHTNMAIVHLHRSDAAAAEAALRKALEIEPRWIPALVNLADLYRASGRDDEAGALLEQAAHSPVTSADAAYAYALWLTRTNQADRALAEFARAATQAPEVLQFTYAYALALNAAGRIDEAIAALTAAHAQFGDHRDLLIALATMNRDRGAMDEAVRYAERLVELFPMEQGFQQLLESLRQRSL